MLDAVVVSLCGFADDLHDVVTLALVIKVGPDKLNRIAECVDGCDADIIVGLFLASALDDGRQDGIGVVPEGVPQVRIIGVANEANRG